MSQLQTLQEEEVVIRSGAADLRGTLTVPSGATGVVLFAHGSGSSRHSPRNRYVADVLQRAGLATLLMDLLTSDEERQEQYTGHLRFDIPLLAGRLVDATDWLERQERTRGLSIGYFGASTGAAAALVAAARRPQVRAVVSRGGRPDLAEPWLSQVQAPTLLIVGGHDWPVIPLNERALELLGSRCKRLEIIPGATHLFEEPGALEAVATLARDWLREYLASPAATCTAQQGTPDRD